MAEEDETEDQVPAGVQLQAPTVPIDHGRAMGFSRRGQGVPQGQDAGVAVADPTQPESASYADLPAASFNPQGDAAPAAIPDRNARYAAARAKVDATAKAAYDDAYRQSLPVNPNGPVVQPLAYKQAERQSDIEFNQQQTEQRKQALIKNRQSEIDARASGMEMTRDENGNPVQALEPRTGRPLYKATKWTVGTDPKSGEPALTMIDQYGQRQFKAPKLVSNPDLTDNQLYYQMPDGTQQPAGDMDELTKHPNFNIARKAMQAVRQKKSAMWKEAIEPMQQVKDGMDAQFDVAKQKADDLTNQAAELQQKIGSFSENQLNETEGGVMGIGSKPTAAAQQAQAEKAALESQYQQVTTEQAALGEQLKPSGELYRKRQQAALSLGLFKAKAGHQNYASVADERRMILKAQGQPEESDPVLQSILQAQKAHADAIQNYGQIAAKTFGPDAASTGEALETGTSVKGKPGVFQSVPAGPHLNDPVVDPENPNAPPPPASKLTLSTRGDIAPQISPAPTQTAPTPAVTPETTSPATHSAAQSSEPFALMQKGTKSVGGLSVQELARRYGSGQGAVSPASLLKINNRSQEIDQMLSDKGTQLDGKVAEGLKKEKDYLDALYTQRIARLPVDVQNNLKKVIANQTTSAAGAAGRAAGTSVGPAAAFAAGFAGGARLLQPTAGATRGLGPLAGGIAGGILASVLANKAQNAALKKFAPDTHAELQDLQAKDAEQHPLAQTVGETAANAAVFKIEPGMAAKGVVALTKIARGQTVSQAEQMAAKALAVQSGLATAQSVGQPLVEGEKVKPGQVASSVAQMLLFGSPRGALGRLGEPPVKPAPPAPEAPKPPAEPFKPTGEGVPKKAAESAEVLAPGAKEETQAAAAQRPEPIKKAEESAAVFKAQEEINRRAAAKEESAQKIVDDIQKTTGKSRGEILATRAGKSIEDWTKELQDEARYQKNPLVVDPERRATELRAQIKQSDEDFAKHLDRTAAEAEQAAQIDQTKKDAGEKFQQLKSDVMARHEELTSRRQAIEDELTAAERLRQSPEGAAKLKDQLSQESKPSTENSDALPKQEPAAIPLQPASRDSEAVGKGNAVDQGASGKGEEGASAVSKEDPVADRARYEQISARMKEITIAKKGAALDDPEFKKLFSENEAIKNRNSSDPGMPPEPITSETKPATKSKNEAKPNVRVETAPPDEAVKSPKSRTVVGDARKDEGKGEKTVREEIVPANKHGEVEGDKLSKEWTEFHPESKGLGIPRSEMPQVHAEHRGALTQFLKGQGIESQKALVRPTDLKPTQNEYSQAKVEKARKFEGGERSILVSSDNHVVDGHHQWVAALHDDPKTPMKVIRLDAPIKDLLPKVREFPSAESASGATKVTPKEAAPEPTKSYPETKRPTDDEFKTPPAQMKPADRIAELTEAGVKEVNGKPLSEANSAELINAVGKLRRGKLGVTDEPRTVDSIIEKLKSKKLFKPGEGKVSASDPLSLAYMAAHDTALDAAILGLKAGRSLAHMIQLALSRFRAAFPQATKAQEEKLESAIREAHGEGPEKSPPQEKAEKKASAVLASPKAEKTKTTLIDRWNKAAKEGDLKQTLAYTRDVADNQAAVTSREARNTVNNELERSVPKSDVSVAQDALGFHVEAGDGGKKALAEMRSKIEASTKVSPKWKERALKAIDYASSNYDALKSSADLYRQFTDQQVAQEQAAGMPTLKRDNYVMHAQDVDEGGWLDKGGGISPTGASSRKNRVHDTFADSLAAGVDPKTLNAVDLLETRVKNGQTGINLRQWQASLHNYQDPTTKDPIAVPSPKVERADGTYYYQAPKGYENEFLNGTPISVKQEYAGTIGALTDPSWWSKTKGRRLTQKLNGAGKSINLLIDTFHLGRLAGVQGINKMASLSDFHVPLPSYNDGRTVLEHSADELTKMAKNGEISPEALPVLLEKKKSLNLLTAAGLNTGHVADAMHQELIRAIPGVGGINKFIFEKFQRGAMSEAALMEFERQTKDNPEMKPAEVARKVAKDVNTLFGNLGRQGIFKSRTAQDIARLIWLAPQWNEALIRKEVGGAGQIASSVKDAALGRGIAMGALGRQMVAGTLGIFAANQLINQVTRGKYTWENPEEGWGSKLSAWIPDSVGGKGSGFFLNPLGVTAEISHLLLNKYERTESGWKTFVDFMRSRASAVTRPAWTAISGETALGAKIKPGDMTKEVAKSSVPLPIGGEAAYSAARGAMNHGNTETYPGQFQKQVMSSVGLKTDTAPSPEQRISKLAQDFNKTKKIEPAAEFYAGDYTDLDNALRRDNASDIKSELQSLMSKKTAQQIEQHYKSWAKHPFTGQRSREAEFVRTLSPEQKQTYLRAQQNRLAVGGRALNAILRMPRQPVTN